MTLQYKASAILQSRTRFAWLRLLRLGAVAPRTVESVPAFMRNASETSLSPMACVTCVKSRETAWLQGVNVRLCACTPCSLARLATKCPGISWHSCLRMYTNGPLDCGCGVFSYPPSGGFPRHIPAFSFAGYGMKVTAENSFPWRGKNALLPSTGMKGRDGVQRGKDLVASKILVFEGDDFFVGNGLGLRGLGPAPAFVPIRWSGMGRGRDGLGGR